VLFDLGNTLARYYERAEFGPILERSVQAVLAELGRRGIRAPDFDAAMSAAREENREAPDFRFTPMEARLSRIFRLEAPESTLLRALCERFLGPIFAVGRVYDDTLPALERLRTAGFPTAIVSNAPWGSPPNLWRDELERLRLAPAVDKVILCVDVGWRKPAAQIFHRAAEEVGVPSESCIFVGDEPHWDVAGSSAVGMQAILIDREGHNPAHSGPRIRNLQELMSYLGAIVA
jgi:putative hydrolase of the HAD superfamily